MIKASSKEEIGAYLKSIRLAKGISTYKIRKETNLQNGPIESIESGSANYSIDSLLNYTSAIGVNISFEEKAIDNNDDEL